MHEADVSIFSLFCFGCWSGRFTFDKGNAREYPFDARHSPSSAALSASQKNKIGKKAKAIKTFYGHLEVGVSLYRCTLGKMRAA